MSCKIGGVFIKQWMERKDNALSHIFILDHFRRCWIKKRKWKKFVWETFAWVSPMRPFILSTHHIHPIPLSIHLHPFIHHIVNPIDPSHPTFHPSLSIRLICQSHLFYHLHPSINPIVNPFPLSIHPSSSIHPICQSQPSIHWVSENNWLFKIIASQNHRRHWHLSWTGMSVEIPGWNIQDWAASRYCMRTTDTTVSQMLRCCLCYTSQLLYCQS